MKHLSLNTAALATSLLAALVTTGCVSGLEGHERAAIGTGGGALLGGVIGHQLDDDAGRYVGAALGALAGGLIGNYMDQQQRALQTQMAGTAVDVRRVDDATLQLNIPGEVLFATNQSDISPNFHATLNQIAQTLQQYPNTIVHVYGFTDSTGQMAYNQSLSERRAQSAAQYLQYQGVPSQRFVVRGYGMNHPRADNTTPYGRQQNRRVEIYIRGLQEGMEQQAYQPVYY